MLFQTPEFLLLVSATLLLYYLWAGPDQRIGVLAGASVAFYAWSGWFDTMLFLGMMSVVYWLSRRVTHLGPKWPRVLALALLFASLGVFKYSAFVASNFNWFAEQVGIS